MVLRSMWSGFALLATYDFTQLPNEGRLLYETQNWGMSGARWRELAATALAELGLESRV